MERVVLSASNGMMYTNGIAGGKTVYLGVGQTPDGWYEVPEHEFMNAFEKGSSYGQLTAEEALNIIMGGEDNDEERSDGTETSDGDSGTQS